VRADKRLSKQTIEKLREEILEAGGNEVFALGFLDDSGLVSGITVTARGNINSVLAVRDKFTNPDFLIHNHPSGLLLPSDNDLIIASRAARGGIGFLIADNAVEKVYVVAEPAKRRKREALNPDKIIAALEEGGVIAGRLTAFETRQSQLDLMRLVIRAFNEDCIIAAEAGTGVGKSFAYLLPALHFAGLNAERIVISTATITLQQQLYEKDIPLVQAALKSKVKTVLVKGRGNYLCLRRMEEALREPSPDEEENESLDAIVRWADTSKTGSRSDLSFMPAESLWSRICSEADTCMGLRCPRREHCFVLALRREAADAGILIVNHHLLFADLAARLSSNEYENTIVLPPYSRVIIDEAHRMEEAATSFFSGEISRPGILRQLGRLYRKKRAQRSGWLLRLASMTDAGLLALRRDGESEEGEDLLAEMVNRVRTAVEKLDDPALELCSLDGVFRLTPQKAELIRINLLPFFAALGKQLNALGSLIRDMLEQVPKDTKDDGTLWEAASLARRLDAAANICTLFLEYEENPGMVCWIERRESQREPWAKYTVTPINVAQSLKDALFEPAKTVICVSATLTTGQGERAFDYWKKNCGIALFNENEKKVFFGIFPSPFPYETSSLLAVPLDAPLPNEDGFSGFVDKGAKALAECSGGSALILFTSYYALQSAYEFARPDLEKLGIRVLKQGDDDRSRLLQTFLGDKSSVLFATESFWEGVDAPGDTLRLVVLCRLPFKTPNDPVFEARCESLEKAGGNAFMDLSLPEAVMKFRQGFGRLMRRSSDRGVVAVLDGRLLKKRYGQIFLQSLPETKTCFKDFKTLLNTVENFLFP
jgi:ATP-dependent DNA helicase DinG